jgi:hypothetical protein
MLGASTYVAGNAVNQDSGDYFRRHFHELTWSSIRVLSGFVANSPDCHFTRRKESIISTPRCGRDSLAGPTKVST